MGDTEDDEVGRSKENGDGDGDGVDDRKHEAAVKVAQAALKYRLHRRSRKGRLEVDHRISSPLLLFQRRWRDSRRIL